MSIFISNESIVCYTSPHIETVSDFGSWDLGIHASINNQKDPNDYTELQIASNSNFIKIRDIDNWSSSASFYEILHILEPNKDYRHTRLYETITQEELDYTKKSYYLRNYLVSTYGLDFLLYKNDFEKELVDCVCVINFSKLTIVNNHVSSSIILSVNNQLIANGKLVNQIGEYLSKNIDSVYKIERNPNQYEIYFYILYQMKDIPGYTRDDPDVYELKVSLNITCYQDKIRVNFIDQLGYGKVLGSWILPVSKLQDVHTARETIYSKIESRLEKLYGKDYDYIF